MKLPLIALTLCALSVPAFADINDTDLRNVKSVKLAREINFGFNLSDEGFYLEPSSNFVTGSAAEQLKVVGESYNITCDIRPLGQINARKEIAAPIGREYRVELSQTGKIILLDQSGFRVMQVECREKESFRRLNGAEINPAELSRILGDAEIKFDNKSGVIERQNIKFKGDFQTQMEEIKVKFKGDVETQLEEIEI